jgi:serine protease
MRRLLSFLAPVAILATLCAAGPAQAKIGLAQERGFVPHRVVLRLDDQRTGRAISLPPGVSVQRTVAALRRNPRVVYAEPDYIATASATSPSFVPDDSGSLEGPAEAAAAAGSWAYKQWNFLPWEEEPGSHLPTSPGGIDAVAGWGNLITRGRPGAAGVTVAVLDTGVAYANDGPEFLRSPDFSADQFVTGRDLVDPGSPPDDENGHGTHVAGTIAERTDNAIGLTGLAYRANLMPVRVLDKYGRGTAVKIAKGIQFAVAHRANVINMSFNFGCRKRVPMVDEALREAYEHGVVTVASAGNIGSETCVSEPATGPRVIAVGGTTEGGCLGNYSLSGGSIDVVAPGGGEPVSGCPSILARPILQVTLAPGVTNAFAIPTTYIGTSMAAAHVSGLAAMVIARGYQRRGPNRLRATHIVNAVTGRLRKTARNLGLPPNQQGAGLVDAGRATERKIFLR